MFACLDALVYEILFYKPEILKEKNKVRRSKLRRKIREQRQQATPKEMEQEAQKRADTMKEKRQKQTSQTSRFQHKP